MVSPDPALAPDPSQPTMPDPPDPLTPQTALLDPPRPAEEHIGTCNWCWSYWDHTLAADRWAPTGERPGVVGDGPPCPFCDRSAYQLRRFIRGKAPQRLDVAICFGCGHVLGLTEATDAAATTATAAAPLAEASEADGAAAIAARADEADVSLAVATALEEADVDTAGPSETHRFVRFPQPRMDSIEGDDEASERIGFHTLQRWEIAQLLLLGIALLLVLNAFIWYQRGKEMGVF